MSHYHLFFSLPYRSPWGSCCWTAAHTSIRMQSCRDFWCLVQGHSDMWLRGTGNKTTNAGVHGQLTHRLLTAMIRAYVLCQMSTYVFAMYCPVVTTEICFLTAFCSSLFYHSKKKENHVQNDVCYFLVYCSFGS